MMPLNGHRRHALLFLRLRSLFLTAVLIGSASQQPALSDATTTPVLGRNLRRRRRRGRRLGRAQQLPRQGNFRDDATIDTTSKNEAAVMLQHHQHRHVSVDSTSFRCPEPSFTPFEKGVEQGLVDATTLSEASGLVASVINPGILWTHNDMGYQRNHGGRGSGNGIIVASRDDGTIARTFLLEGADSLDYEDIAAGPGPVEGRHYLYVGDIGRARGHRDSIVVYRVAEPLVGNTDAVDGNDDEKVDSDALISITEWDALTLFYPGVHQHNAESLIYDPLTHHLYIISRDDGSVWRTERVWREEGDAAMKLVQVGTKRSQPHRSVTGADISRDGREVLVKHYSSILYYCREPEEDLGMVLSTREGIKVPYKREIRGESVAFAAQRELGYFTLSESGGKVGAVPLYRYNRVPEI